MALVILRLVFFAVAVGLGVRLLDNIYGGQLPSDPVWLPFPVVVGIPVLALLVIGLDMLVARKRMDTIASVYFGLIVGLFLTYVFYLALGPVLPTAGKDVAKWMPLVLAVLGTVLCYTCISLLLQTKDDFRFIIPYVEFAKEVKGLKPLVLDTSVIIDGRIADVIETHVFDTQLVMPRFVIGELQAIADSSDKLRRARGRRGLDILNRLRNLPNVDLKIYDREPSELAGEPVDSKLVLLAKHLEGKIVTNDYNLNKVAKLHGVGVINLNDLANALKPVCLPGEVIRVQIVKAGEEPGQGVGYLEDGTMVVIEGGREQINNMLEITVTSVLQTSAGRMIFGRYEAPVRA